MLLGEGSVFQLFGLPSVETNNKKTKAVKAYKTVLQSVVSRCPPGTKRMIAERLGKSKSFVSQILNPAYETPVPKRDAELLIEICGFNKSEESRFRALYSTAHPAAVGSKGKDDVYKVCVALPNYPDVEQRIRVEEAILESARTIINLMGGESSREA